MKVNYHTLVISGGVVVQVTHKVYLECNSSRKISDVEKPNVT
jgi:hypothetical protein